MSLCSACGLALAGDADFCPYHQTGYAEDWAVANRIMCDFVHRGREYTQEEVAELRRLMGLRDPPPPLATDPADG